MTEEQKLESGLSTSSIDSNKVFNKMLQWQLMATAAVAIIAAVVSGVHAGFSAVAGGLSVTIGAYFASKIAQRSSKEAATVLVNLLKAEAVKIVIIVVLLFITFKVYKQLVPFALIAGLAAAALFSGAAMSKLDKTELEI
ncbi:MAG: ATP synthase subunit I [Methylotenera sp.]|nr:ATP synthase subunit I [Methylotenera sp.]